MSTTVATYVHNLIAPAIDDWFVKQCANPEVRMHAFFRPADGRTPGAFFIGPVKPSSDWQLVTQDAVRTDWTKAQVQQWIYTLSRSLPILPAESDLAA